MSTNQETIRKKETEITRLEHILALLSWDQETGMPGNALQERSEQMAWIQQQISDRILDPRWEEELAALGSQASGSEERSWHRALVRRHRQYSCLPPTFMAELVKVTSLARDAWASARRENDFSLFQPHLEQVVDLAVQRAGLLGFKAEPYDALLDLYEPGMTAAELEKVFNPLETELKPLIGLAEEKQNGAAPYDRRYPIAGQEALSKRVLRDMGFDFAFLIPFQKFLSAVHQHLVLELFLHYDLLLVTKGFLPGFGQNLILGQPFQPLPRALFQPFGQFHQIRHRVDSEDEF